MIIGLAIIIYLILCLFSDNEVNAENLYICCFACIFELIFIDALIYNIFF